MSQTYSDLISQLFREIEVDLGATNLSVLVLESLYDSVKEIKKQDIHNFFHQLEELTDNVNSTKPRYAIIIDSFYEVLKLAYDEDIAHPEAGWPIKKSIFLSKMKKLIRERKTEKKRIVQQSEKINFKDKTILLYNHSPTIESVLTAAKRRKEKFNVIVAEQDPDKTGEIIDFLHHARIPYRVVPSYMISHLDEDIDYLFLGALTLKSTMDFVMDTGANGMVAQFHLKKKPIFVFISTSKYSLWKAKKRVEVFKHVHERKHPLRSINYERIKFSHDRVELKHINKIVTEEGIFTPKQIEKTYNAKLKARLKLEHRVKFLS